MEVSSPHLGNCPEVMESVASWSTGHSGRRVGEVYNLRPVRAWVKIAAPGCETTGDLQYLHLHPACWVSRALQSMELEQRALCPTSAQCRSIQGPSCPSPRHQVGCQKLTPKSQSPHLGKGWEWGQCVLCISEAKTSLAGQSLKLWLWLLISVEGRKMWTVPQQQYLLI